MSTDSALQSRRFWSYAIDRRGLEWRYPPGHPLHPWRALLSCFRLAHDEGVPSAAEWRCSKFEEELYCITADWRNLAGERVGQG